MNARNVALAAGVASAVSLVAAVAYAKAMTAQDFVTKASVANMFEIDSSRLALDKAQNDDVQTFAQKMIDDHTMAGEKLSSVLASADSTLRPASELDTKHQKLLDKLKAASESEFDKHYISMQLDAHKEAVSLFSDYSKNGKDRALKDFAAETLPTLKEHLQHVQQLNVKTNK